VRVLPHIKKLDDCFGQLFVRVICDCGACREIEPEALARLVGWRMTLTSRAATGSRCLIALRLPHRVAFQVEAQSPPGL
jgi:hypothetical protein